LPKIFKCKNHSQKESGQKIIEEIARQIKRKEDCCTLFTPKHATAKGNLKEIEEVERNLSLKKIIKESQKEIEILNY
jgi:adenylyl- and sulfurtransferase ThiI